MRTCIPKCLRLLFCGSLILFECSTHAGVIGHQYFPAGILSTVDAKWFERQLRGLREKPLYPPKSKETFRIFWLPTFTHPCSVRVTRLRGRYWLTVKMASGMGGYAPGAVVYSRTRRMKVDETETLIRVLRDPGFWTHQPTKGPIGNNDGTEWVLEAAYSGEYHLVERSTPIMDPQFRDICLRMGKLSGLNVGAGSLQ